MKAYVIKNKEGKYYSDNDVEPLPSVGRYSDKIIPIFCDDIIFAHKYLDEADAKYASKLNNIKDYTIVQTTICEGDLEEKYKVLQGVIRLAMDYACKDKKLYKRIQDFNASTNRHNGDNNVYLEDAVCFLTKLSKDARDDSKKWGEFFEKVYQEQKAQESERNGINDL